MIALLVVAIFIFYTEMMPSKINAVDLAAAYSINPTEADEKYLLKEIELTGTVKAYYKILDIRNVLELNNNKNDIDIYCFFLQESDEYIASQLQEGDTITVIGTVAGMEKYNFVDGLKIDVKKFKE